jgi:hypothetical protein
MQDQGLGVVAMTDSQARATAEATSPPIPRADLVYISIIRGRTSETPAKTLEPSPGNDVMTPS